MICKEGANGRRYAPAADDKRECSGKIAKELQPHNSCTESIARYTTI